MDQKSGGSISCASKQVGSDHTITKIKLYRRFLQAIQVQMILPSAVLNDSVAWLELMVVYVGDLKTREKLSGIKSQCQSLMYSN